MNNKTLYVSLIVVALLAIGAYFYPKSSSLVGAASPSGSTNCGRFGCEVSFTPNGTNGSSTSMLNNFGSDEFIVQSDISCENVGTAGQPVSAWTLQAATTTVNANGLQGNTNYALNLSSIATSSTAVYVASTTEGVLTGFSRIWPQNTYMTFNFNATSSTAVCGLGMELNPI